MIKLYYLPNNPSFEGGVEFETHEEARKFLLQYVCHECQETYGTTLEEILISDCGLKWHFEIV